jgi:hypothetical protein
MKKVSTILLVYFFCIPFSGKAQESICSFETDSLTGQKVYKTADIKPVFSAENGDFYKFLLKHIKWPGGYYCGEETLIATFIISESGEITNVKLIKKSVFEPANSEFIRVLKLSPKWIPAFCNSLPVAYKNTLLFRLEIQR